MVLVALLRCRGGLAYGSAELVKFAFSIVQLAIDHLQPRNERTHVDTRGLHDPIRYFDGGLLQYAKNPSMRRIRYCLSIRPTDDLRTWVALAGVGAMSQSLRNHGAVSSSVSSSIWG